MTQPSPSATPLLDALRRCPVVGIVRAPDAATAVAHVHRIVAAGVAAVEVSLATPEALDAIRQLAATYHATQPPTGGVLVGVGTVLHPDELRAAVEAGARYVVTPTTDPEVLAAARDLGVPVIAGAATPSEIQQALRGGAAAIKLFPASLWSIRAFTDLRTVFCDTPFVPTGGIGHDDAAAWLEAGALAVGVGSALTSGRLDLDELRRHHGGMPS